MRPPAWIAIGVALVLAAAAGMWLYWMSVVDNAYGRSVVAQSLSLFEMGRVQVVASIESEGVMPASAERVGIEPVDRHFGPKDRNIRLRMEMLPGGVVLLRYDGWKFDGAQLRMVPRVVNKELLWTCEATGIRRAWLEDYCFQIEQQRVALGFDPTAPLPPRQEPTPEPAATEDPSDGT